MVWQKWSPCPNFDQHGSLETRGWLRQTETGSWTEQKPPGAQVSLNNGVASSVLLIKARRKHLGRWQRGKKKKSPVAGWPRMPQDLGDKPQHREKLLWMVQGPLSAVENTQVSWAEPRPGFPGCPQGRTLTSLGGGLTNLVIQLGAAQKPQGWVRAATQNLCQRADHRCRLGPQPSTLRFQSRCIPVLLFGSHGTNKINMAYAKKRGWRGMPFPCSHVW